MTIPADIPHQETLNLVKGLVARLASAGSMGHGRTVCQTSLDELDHLGGKPPNVRLVGSIISDTGILTVNAQMVGATLAVQFSKSSGVIKDLVSMADTVKRTLLKAHDKARKKPALTLVQNDLTDDGQQPL